MSSFHPKTCQILHHFCFLRVNVGSAGWLGKRTLSRDTKMTASHNRLHYTCMDYEISLPVLKNISRMRAVSEKRNFLSPSDRVMFFSDYMNTMK